MASSDRPKILVLDSTAFYAGIPLTGEAQHYTTPSIIREVSHGRAARLALLALAEAGRITILQPLPNWIRYAKEKARESGDVSAVSEADVSLIALGLQMKQQGYEVLVVSDDYSVQNLSSLLNLKFSPTITKGISKVIRWLIYCPGCGKTFDRRVAICDVCGTKLRRKAKKS